MKKPKLTSVESRYTTYVAWCLSLDIQPASFEAWGTTVKQIQELTAGPVLPGLTRTRGNGLLLYREAIAS